MLESVGLKSWLWCHGVKLIGSILFLLFSIEDQELSAQNTASKMSLKYASKVGGETWALEKDAIKR